MRQCELQHVVVFRNTVLMTTTDVLIYLLMEHRGCTQTKSILEILSGLDNV